MLINCETNAPLPSDDYCIIHREDGLDELEFSLPTAVPEWQELNEETRLLETCEQIYYRIRAVQADEDSASIRCQIDLDDWKDRILGSWTDGQHTPWTVDTPCTALTFLTWVSASIGWTIGGDTDGTLALPLQLDGPTRLDVALQLAESFGIYLRFDNRKKVVTMVEPARRTLSGSYAAPEVNLRGLSYTGSSKSFATRLYAEGKDGLTFSGLNDGLPYLEDFTYSSRVICAFLKDERCTTAEDLLAAARLKLAALAVPQRSWQLKVVDLYRMDPAFWKDMPLTLFTVLRISDPKKGCFLAAQVVEDKVWPCYPHKNEITVSTVPGSLQRTVRRLAGALEDRNSPFWQRMAQWK